MTDRVALQRAPWWRSPAAVTGVVTIVVVGLMAWDTTFVSGGGEIQADTAVEYAELNYDEFIVPSITERAQPLPELITAILDDVDGAGEEFGRREDDAKPFSFPTIATGTITEGAFGEVGLDVDGLPEGITAAVAIPPLGSSTALRDAGTELAFGDFVNQTEYQAAAVEINNLAAERAYDGRDLSAMLGSRITVTGAFTWSSNTGGEVTHVTIYPVLIEDAS